jgi:hypothetical protein
MTMNRIITAAVLFLAAFSLAGADTLTLGLYQNATNNLFQTSLGEKDQVTSLAYSYAKGLQPFSLFAEGSYAHLYENSNVSFASQELGLDYVLTLGSRTAFYLAAKGAGTLYGSDFRDLNFLSLGFVAALKSYVAPSSTLNLNYAFDYRDYRWSLFDYDSHLASLSLDKYFETKTTLKTDVTWGRKVFFHPYTLVVEPTSEASVFTPTGSMGAGGGRGYGGGWGGGALPPPEVTGPGAALQIASVSGLVAQGLGSRVGLRLSGVRQWTLSGENPFGSVDEFYLVENPTYDVFSWNGYGLSGQLTVEAPWMLQLKISYTRFVKEFPGIEAMDLDGASLGILREDRRGQLEVRLGKNFRAVSLFLSYAYIKNRSNDPFFAWQGHFLSAGFEWNANWGGGR